MLIGLQVVLASLTGGLFGSRWGSVLSTYDKSGPSVSAALKRCSESCLTAVVWGGGAGAGGGG